MDNIMKIFVKKIHELRQGLKNNLENPPGQ